MIVECPHCHTRVLPKDDNICPACHRNISDIQDVDPNMVSLTVRESQELPPYCYLCNSYTDRSVRIEGDPEASWETMIRLLVPHWKRQTDQGTTNVFINLPQCEVCAEQEDPAPLYVDYEQQTMTFVVHKDFRERVQPSPIDKRQPELEEASDEEDIE